jgi:hypothetical protein
MTTAWMQEVEQRREQLPRVREESARFMASIRSNIVWPCGLALAGLCAVALLAGCAQVKPYEREMLADPIMSFSRGPLSDQYLDHVYDVREGARGATTSQGGGCGCN